MSENVRLKYIGRDDRMCSVLSCDRFMCGCIDIGVLGIPLCEEHAIEYTQQSADLTRLRAELKKEKADKADARRLLDRARFRLPRECQGLIVEIANFLETTR